MEYSKNLLYYCFHFINLGGPLVCGELLVEDDITEQLDNSLIANDNKFPLSEHDRILLTQKTNLTQQSSPSLNDSPVEDVYLPLSLSESQFSFGNTKDSSPTMSVENMLETMNKQYLTDVDLQDMDHIDFTGESNNIVSEPKEEVKKVERRKSLNEEKVTVLRNDYGFSSFDINALTAIIGADNLNSDTGTTRKNGLKREHSQTEVGKPQQPVRYCQNTNHTPPKRAKVDSPANMREIVSKDKSVQGESEQPTSSRTPAHATYPVRQNNKTRVTAAVKHPHLKANDNKKILPPTKIDCKNTTSKDTNITIPKLPDLGRTRNGKVYGGFSERRCDTTDVLFDPKRYRNPSPLSLPRISDSPTTKQKRSFGDEKPRPPTQAEINATFDRLKSEPAENHLIKVMKVAESERHPAFAYRNAKTPDGRLCRGNPGPSNQYVNSRGCRPAGSSSVRIPNESSR